MRTLTILAALIVLAAPAAAQEQAVVKASEASVYADPAFDAAALAELTRGTVLQVLEHRGDWLRVLAADRVGFVHSALIEVLPSTAPAQQAQVPMTQPRQGTPAGQGQPVAQQYGGFEAKSPSTARLFSILITGGGHLYAGETTKGITLMGISIGAYVAGVTLSSTSCDFSSTSFGCSENLAPLYIGAAVGLGTWIYGIMDADDAAHRANRRAQGLMAQARPYVGMNSQGQTSLGLSLPLPGF